MNLKNLPGATYLEFLTAKDGDLIAVRDHGHLCVTVALPWSDQWPDHKVQPCENCQLNTLCRRKRRSTNNMCHFRDLYHRSSSRLYFPAVTRVFTYTGHSVLRILGRSILSMDISQSFNDKPQIHIDAILDRVEIERSEKRLINVQFFSDSNQQVIEAPLSSYCHQSRRTTGEDF